MCGFGDDAVGVFDTNVPIAFSCREEEILLLLINKFQFTIL